VEFQLLEDEKADKKKRQKQTMIQLSTVRKSTFIGYLSAY
jgi:hypothetical protein